MLVGWFRMAGAADHGHRSHTGNSPACIAQAPPGATGRRSRHLPEKGSSPFSLHIPLGTLLPWGGCSRFSGEHFMSHRHPPACPLCSCEGALLGALGSCTWFRCRQCGMDFSDTHRPKRPVPVAATTSPERQA
jgi:hypothetical protein